MSAVAGYPSTVARVLTRAATRLAAHKVPQNASGKLLKLELRDRLSPVGAAL